jgi:hypothetical protein
MNRDTDTTLESLKQLDQRQDQLLKELEELNLRIEKVLSLYQTSRGSASQAPVPKPSENKRAA